MNENKNKIVSFLDRVAPKNKLQIDAMHELGYSPVFFANTYIELSKAYFSGNDQYFLLAPGFFKRFKQIFSFIKNNHHSIHHAEVYPGGRFSFLYLLIARIFRIKTICVERGDLLYFKKGGYDPVTRFSMWVCYKYASLVWYREVYMEALLKNMGVKKLFFIHNAVNTETQTDFLENISFKDKRIDFLWVNRLIPERMSNWFIETLHSKEFTDTNNVLAGILQQTLYHTEQQYAMDHAPGNLEMIDFVADPSTLYKQAKFFVLPAKVVFANNALLEAMSFGVVPVIVNSPGYELIVKDGVNGIVSVFDKTAFEEAMLRAHTLSEAAYTKMSEAAKEQIRQSFSSGAYREKLSELYHKIEY